jgi:hypothetical protein
MFHKNNVPGSMIYLSSGFVIPNLNLIKKAGYGVMAYKDQPFFSQENASLINDEYE